MLVERMKVDRLIKTYLPNYWSYLMDVFDKELPNEDAAFVTKCGNCIHWHDKKCDELGIIVINPNFFCGGGAE